MTGLLRYLLALRLLGLFNRRGRGSEVEGKGVILTRLHGELVVGFSLVAGHVVAIGFLLGHVFDVGGVVLPESSSTHLNIYI